MNLPTLPDKLAAVVVKGKASPYVHAMEDCTHVMTLAPQLCRRCKELRRWFINREGRSCCHRCDEEQERHAATAQL